MSEKVTPPKKIESMSFQISARKNATLEFAPETFLDFTLTRPLDNANSSLMHHIDMETVRLSHCTKNMHVQNSERSAVSMADIEKNNLNSNKNLVVMNE